MNPSKITLFDQWNTGSFTPENEEEKSALESFKMAESFTEKAILAKVFPHLFI